MSLELILGQRPIAIRHKESELGQVLHLLDIDVRQVLIVHTKLLAPLLTRFTVIHLKPYTKDEFVEIAINVLNRDEGIEKDVAKFIAELVFDKLSSNIRECTRIARLAGNNIAKVQRIVDMLTTYSNRPVKIGT
jgi:ATP-dependent Lon protease